MRLAIQLAALMVGGVLLLYPIHASTSSGGAPPGYSGGPGDFGTCQTCHQDFDVNEGTGSVTVTAPSAYQPGQSYTFTVTVDNTTEPANGDPVQGFQLSVQDAEGNFIGELVITDADATRFSFGGNHVTHTSSGRTQDSWTMDWIAPDEENAPDVLTVYVSANAADGNFNVSGDYVYTTSAEMERTKTSSEPTVVPGAFTLEALYPNPLRSGSAQVEFTMEQVLPVELIIYDSLGREVRASTLGVRPEGSHTVTLGVDGLPSGLYFVRVVTPEGLVTRPFTIAR